MVNIDSVNIKINEELKKQAEMLLPKLGVDEIKEDIFYNIAENTRESGQQNFRSSVVLVMR